jgi:thioredoxin reductase (NADPH)
LRAFPLFAGLPESELARVVGKAADLRLAPGEYAVHEGEQRALFVVLDGNIEVTKRFDGVERTIGRRVAGQIFGEVPIALGGPFIGSYRATEPSRVVRIEPSQYYSLAAAWPAVADAVGALARERIGGLQGLAAEAQKTQATILGHRWDPACHDLRRFLARNQLTFEWLTPDDEKLATKWPGPRPGDDALPALLLSDGTTLARPQPREIAQRLGLQTRPRSDEYDTIIVGAGPAGLAAAVYGASEGLRTLVVEREAPGGQAGTSSRIENYLGFPNGVSGDELAIRALEQAKRLGAEILVTRNIARIDTGTRTVMLDDGEALCARTVILATGVTWRRLAIDGFDRFIGKGIYYGAARSEASNTQGLDVHLIGAGNSAGQAALFFASYARSVTLLVRGDALESSMSHYLVEQVRTKPNVRVLTRTEVVGVHGDGHLAAIDLADRGKGTVQRTDCGGLFVFIGADAQTEWLAKPTSRATRAAMS